MWLCNKHNSDPVIHLNASPDVANQMFCSRTPSTANPPESDPRSHVQRVNCQETQRTEDSSQKHASTPRLKWLMVDSEWLLLIVGPGNLKATLFVV